MTLDYVKDANGIFVCQHKGCTRTFAKQNTMYYHMKRHMAEEQKTYDYHCPQCNSGFIQKSTFLQHMAAIHPETKDVCIDAESKETIKNPYIGMEFKCPCCDNTTRTKANALVHYARLHAKDWIPTYEKDKGCTKCNKTFSSIAAYLYHCTGCIPANKKHRTNIAKLIG